MSTTMTVSQAAQFLRENNIVAGLPLTRDPLVVVQGALRIAIRKHGRIYKVVTK